MSECARRQPSELHAKLRLNWRHFGGVAEKMIGGAFGEDAGSQEAKAGYSRLEIAPAFTAVHAAAGYSHAEEYGEGGERLRQVMARFDFDVRSLSLAGTVDQQVCDSSAAHATLVRCIMRRCRCITSASKTASGASPRPPAWRARCCFSSGATSRRHATTGATARRAGPRSTT